MFIYSEVCPALFSSGSDSIFWGNKNIFIRGRIAPLKKVCLWDRTHRRRRGEYLHSYM
jgi:hypothetical protein